MDPDEVDWQVADGSAARLGPAPKDAEPSLFPLVMWAGFSALALAILWWLW